MKRAREREQRHMVHLFNVTIKQVILRAFRLDSLFSSLLILFYRERNNLFRSGEKLSFFYCGWKNPGMGLIRDKLSVPAAPLLVQLLVISHNNLPIAWLPFIGSRSLVATEHRLQPKSVFPAIKSTCNSIKSINISDYVPSSIN